MPAGLQFRWQSCCYMKLYHWVKQGLTWHANVVPYVCHSVHKHIKDYMESKNTDKLVNKHRLQK